MNVVSWDDNKELCCTKLSLWSRFWPILLCVVTLSVEALTTEPRRMLPVTRTLSWSKIRHKKCKNIQTILFTTEQRKSKHITHTQKLHYPLTKEPHKHWPWS